LVDPLSGEGIRFAIKSGRLAAESLLKGNPAGYAKALYRDIGLPHYVTMLFSMLFYFFPDLFLFLGIPNPFSTQGIVELLADRISSIEFVLFSFITLPVFVATELAARFLHHLGFVHLSDHIRARIYPEDVNEAYRQEPNLPYSSLNSSRR